MESIENPFAESTRDIRPDVGGRDIAVDTSAVSSIGELLQLQRGGLVLK